jgi:hypothetical protein
MPPKKPLRLSLQQNRYCTSDVDDLAAGAGDGRGGARHRQHQNRRRKDDGNDDDDNDDVDLSAINNTMS